MNKDDFVVTIDRAVVGDCRSVQATVGNWMFRLMDIPGFDGKPSSRLSVGVYFNTGLRIMPRCSHEQQFPGVGDYWPHVDTIRGTLAQCTGVLTQWTLERMDYGSAVETVNKMLQAFTQEVSK